MPIPHFPPRSGSIARVALLPALLFWGCDARLPEPDSPGARLYAERCASGCHRLYAPTLMKFEMWKVTVTRMKGDIARAGQAPLTPAEEQLLLDYLKKHGG